MKIAQLTAFGDPAEVVECIDADEPAAPANDEVLVEMLAGPINPAELLLIQGKYASRPPLPAPLGIEGAGRVLAAGSAVSDVAEGDLVISLTRSNWAERCVMSRAQVIKLPAGIDVQQASMLKVNPATALKMLEDYVTLQPGEWLIQNAANSGVGSCLIALAKAQARGVHTVNVVRREALIAPLKARGADVVVVDGDDLAERVRAEVGDGKIRLAIDAVAGRSCLRLSQCLDDGATVVNYGMLSGEPCQLEPDLAVFKSISLTGFWLAKVLQQTPPEQVQALYGRLAQAVVAGELDVGVEAVYPLVEVKQALAHAMKEGRDGKILVAPNG